MFNLDSSEFFFGTFGPAKPVTLDRYVDSLRQMGVTDLVICVNAQRTNYRSHVWEADWDGYDAKSQNQAAPGTESPWAKNSYRWSLLGVDYPASMLAAARRNRMKGWLSIRMNDAHLPDKPDHPYHSTFWRSHPDWRLPNGALDFSHAEVRAHYIALLREVCERFDMDGLELDFMRFGHYFQNGEGFSNTGLIAGMVREARALTKQAAKRRHHPVRLSVRVPARPWVAEQRGLDAVAWAKESLVDLIIAAPWWASTQSDVPVETWRGALIGTHCSFAASLEDGINSGSDRRRTITVEEARGIALTFLDRGTDATYLFNWFTGPLKEWPRDKYELFLKEAGNADALARRARSIPVTLIDPWADGEPGVPRPLETSKPELMLRLPIGPKPGDEDRISVVIRKDPGSPIPGIAVNGTHCAAGDGASEIFSYPVPPAAMRRGYNLIDIRVGESKLQSVEVRIEPRSSAPRHNENLVQ